MKTYYTNVYFNEETGEPEYGSMLDGHTEAVDELYENGGSIANQFYYRYTIELKQFGTKIHRIDEVVISDYEKELEAEKNLQAENQGRWDE